MKTKSTQTFYKKFVLTCSMFLAISALFSCSIVENVPATTTKKEAGAVKETRTSRKDRSVKIYPDLVKRVMHVKNREDAVLDFFVFDPDGTLVRHYKMSGKEHKKISGLHRGSYIYQVFEEDEMSESGKIIIR